MSRLGLPIRKNVLAVLRIPRLVSENLALLLVDSRSEMLFSCSVSNATVSRVKSRNMGWKVALGEVWYELLYSDDLVIVRHIVSSLVQQLECGLISEVVGVDRAHINRGKGGDLRGGFVPSYILRKKQALIPPLQVREDWPYTIQASI